MSRRQAIEEAFAAASGEPAAFLDRLRRSAETRHLRYSGDIVEDSFVFVLALLEQCYGVLPFNPAWREIPGISLRIDAPDQERIQTCKLPEAPGFRVSSISGAAFAMDELAFLFEPVSAAVPLASDLQQLVIACVSPLSSGRGRASFYLRLPHAYYQFYASDSFRGWQSILSPGFNPDLFQGGWTLPAAEFVRMERQLIARALDDPVVYKANHLDFLRTFWKFLELSLIEATAQRGEIVFAQTPEAVIRGLSVFKLQPAPFLEDFAAAYRKELSGAAADIGRRIPAAIQFLKNIHHELRA